MKLVNINDIKEPKKLVLVNDLLKVYYLSFEKDEILPQHSLNGIGILQVLDGHIIIEFDNGTKYEMRSGDLLEFKSSILHTVIAKDKSRILLTNASYSN